jgi:hypothetical protein
MRISLPSALDSRVYFVLLFPLAYPFLLVFLNAHPSLSSSPVPNLSCGIHSSSSCTDQPIHPSPEPCTSRPPPPDHGVPEIHTTRQIISFYEYMFLRSTICQIGHSQAFCSSMRIQQTYRGGICLVWLWQGVPYGHGARGERQTVVCVPIHYIQLHASIWSTK